MTRRLRYLCLALSAALLLAASGGAVWAEPAGHAHEPAAAGAAADPHGGHAPHRDAAGHDCHAIGGSCVPAVLRAAAALPAVVWRPRARPAPDAPRRARSRPPEAETPPPRL